MLPSGPGVTLQLQALPACVEDLSIDLLANGCFQVDSVENSVQQQVDELLCTAAPEWQEFLSKVDPDSCISGLVFENPKMASSKEDARQRGSDGSPLIPLSVQQAQLDNIDPQAALSQSVDWIVHDEAVQLQFNATDGVPATTTTTMTSCVPQVRAEPRLERPCGAETSASDQTVPLRRHDSVCSMVSCSSDIKKERCSVSDSDSPFIATSQPVSHGAKRGRPCLDDKCDDATLNDKKLRRRAQNRRAATRCRIKRRNEYEQLRKEHEAVMLLNAELQAQLIQVVSQYERLQGELCRHQQLCGLTVPSNVSL